ncbi:MAG: isoprenylcysteine carboxylmethyltransferase family protein [Alphaproteobacteria bacterium]|nr:isoprenylcysteine carboxylmethyltransferase family protein [Alphaproteobacteria bacterium]
MLHIPGSLHAMGAIYAVWLLWVLSWWAAAFFADRAVKRSRWQIVPMIVLVAALVVLSHYLGAATLRMTLWHTPQALRWGLLALVLAGMAFAWWARLTLGRLWSGTITLKPDHHIVDTGPYGLVRHPIYTGLLFSILATVAAQGSVESAMIGAVVVIALFAKARAEERFLSGELGPEAYDAYRQRVPMLIPFGPK